MEKFVAVECQGVVEIHAKPADGNYETLCGLDGDDPGVDQHPADLPKKPRIDCKDCIALIRWAKRYRERDIAPPTSALTRKG